MLAIHCPTGTPPRLTGGPSLSSLSATLNVTEADLTSTLLAIRDRLQGANESEAVAILTTIIEAATDTGTAPDVIARYVSECWQRPLTELTAEAITAQF